MQTFTIRDLRDRSESWCAPAGKLRVTKRRARVVAVPFNEGCCCTVPTALAVRLFDGRSP
jgi:hypothetical protein